MILTTRPSMLTQISSQPTATRPLSTARSGASGILCGVIRMPESGA